MYKNLAQLSGNVANMYGHLADMYSYLAHLYGHFAQLNGYLACIDVVHSQHFIALEQFTFALVSIFAIYQWLAHNPIAKKLTIPSLYCCYQQLGFPPENKFVLVFIVNYLPTGQGSLSEHNL